MKCFIINKQRLLLIGCFIFMGVCFFLEGKDVFAQENEPVTIKVAFYQLDGFFEYNDQGKESGYGVDYLNELKNYMDVRWEYVPVDSWEKIGELLQQGKVDVAMPVSEPAQETVSKRKFTTEDVLSSYHAIMTLKKRSDLYYEDSDTIRHLKIAATKSLLQKTGIEDYLESLGVLKNIVYYKDYNQCKQALKEGNVDALISNVMDLTDDMKILDKFAVTRNYITTKKNSPYYSMINSAMTELELANPSFQTKLYEIYYPERAIEPFTKDEMKYIEKTDKLKIAVFPDRNPVSYYDEKTHTYKGIAIDLTKELSKKIHIKFQYISVDTDHAKDMLDKVDLVMPVHKSGESDKYFVTKSLLDSQVVFAVQSGNDEPEKGAKVGVLKSTIGMQQVIRNLGRYKLVLYQTSEDALKALQQGEIAAFANSSFVINRLLENPRYNNLRLLHYQSFPLEYAICGKADQKILESVLNKGISRISTSMQDNIIKENTNFSFSDLSIFDKFYMYRYELILSLIILMICVIAIVGYNRSRSKYIQEIEKKSIEQEKANQAKSNFLSRMSHDMRTPMNAVIGMSYLGMQSDSVVELQDYHEKINRSGKYLLGLINDSLDMSKMDNDKMVLHPEPYFSAEFLDSIRVIFAEKVKEKNIQFDVSIDKAVNQPAMFDKLRLQQIFVNLINNAIKFSEEQGKVEFQIYVQDVTEDEIQLMFIVRDYGCGMTKEFQKRMYNPFEQGARKDTDKETGTGLGLTIVKQLVELMGGTIECKSAPGEGTEFRVWLRTSIYHGNVEPAMSPELEDGDYGLQGMKALLCEDHPLNVTIARKLLEKEGMTIDVAENGKIGVDMFGSSKPGTYQVILMDIRMPEMDGLEATRQIRKSNHPEAATIPIVAMTANAFAEDREMSKAAGMNAHLAKPIDAKEMYQTLKRLRSSK